MNKIKAALMAVLKRHFWLILLVFITNVGINYWRDGQVSLASCAAIMFGILLVTLLYVVVETYSMNKKK